MSFAFWFLWIAHITNIGKLAAMMKLAQTQGEATRKYALINRLKIEWNDIYCDDLSTSRTNMGNRLFLSVFTFYLFFFPSLMSQILSFFWNNLCKSEKKRCTYFNSENQLHICLNFVFLRKSTKVQNILLHFMRLASAINLLNY